MNKLLALLLAGMLLPALAPPKVDDAIDTIIAMRKEAAMENRISIEANGQVRTAAMNDN